MTCMMPISEILELQSGDFDGDSLRNCIHLVNFAGHGGHEENFYSALRARMAETRINLVPIQRDGRWLTNGHHRVSIACELGFTEMLVSDDREDTDFCSDADWDTVV